MPKRKLSGLAQDVRLARELGLTYGALKAPPVYVRGYAGELYPRIRDALEASRKEDKPAEREGRRCVVCDRRLSGRQKKFCSTACRRSGYDNERKHSEQQKAAEARCCPNCGKPVTGRRIYCDAECGKQFQLREYRKRKRGACP